MPKIMIGINWLLTALLCIAGIVYHDAWWPYIQGNPKLVATAAGTLLSTLIFSINRRVVSREDKSDFFSETTLITTLKNKARYSDRMAYILAEMSELAYFEVEKENDNFVQFAEEAATNSPKNARQLNQLIELYKRQSRTNSTSHTTIRNENDLEKLLSDNNFEYRPPYINAGSTQGFICVRKDKQNPYIVVTFRGSEKKIEDWLTNAKAAPAPNTKVERGKVHGGFYEDFSRVKDTIISTIDDICKDYNNTSIPIYFTGHSLGGAIATIATKELMPDGDGACYTFGAPRVGDYEYFQFVKTPIYRIVNSSDLVPRAPPGAWTTVVLKAFTLIRYLLVKFDWATGPITAAEGWVDRLKDYRHFGDLRYLTDVEAGKFDQVMLLRNPNYLDVCQWFWRHITVSYGMPVKSHKMSIYRKKIAQVGLKRLHQAPIKKSFGFFS